MRGVALEAMVDRLTQRSSQRGGGIVGLDDEAKMGVEDRARRHSALSRGLSLAFRKALAHKEANVLLRLALRVPAATVIT